MNRKFFFFVSFFIWHLRCSLTIPCAFLRQKSRKVRDRSGSTIPPLPLRFLFLVFFFFFFFYILWGKTAGRRTVRVHVQICLGNNLSQKRIVEPLQNTVYRHQFVEALVLPSWLPILRYGKFGWPNGFICPNQNHPKDQSLCAVAFRLRNKRSPCRFHEL
jgi:hypothetical protein